MSQVDWEHADRAYLIKDLSGTFGQLPMMTRALGRELLVISDRWGVITLGDKSVEDVVCLRGGAEMGERRTIRQLLPALLADRYVVRKEGALVIRNYLVCKYSRDPEKLKKSEIERERVLEECALKAKEEKAKKAHQQIAKRSHKKKSGIPTKPAETTDIMTATDNWSAVSLIERPESAPQAPHTRPALSNERPESAPRAPHTRPACTRYLQDVEITQHTAACHVRTDQVIPSLKDKETRDPTTLGQHVPVPLEFSAGASPPEVSLPIDGVSISPPDRAPVGTASRCPTESPEATAVAIGQPTQDPALMAPFCETAGQITEPVLLQPQTLTESHAVLPATTPVCPPLAQDPTLPAAIVSYLSTVLEPMVRAILATTKEPALTELPRPTTEQVAETVADKPCAPTETPALFSETPAVCPPDRAKSSPRPKGARMVPTADEQAVFDHWVTVMGKTGRAIFADERIKPVRERLAAGFSVDDLKQAIDGCAKSTFHMGVNKEHRLYNDLELICRDAKRVESFLTTAEGKALASKAEKAALDPKRPYMQSASREEIAASIARRKQNGRRSYSDIARDIAAGIGI